MKEGNKHREEKKKQPLETMREKEDKLPWGKELGVNHGNGENEKRKRGSVSEEDETTSVIWGPRGK